jgi:hypothetical protein
MLKKTRNSKAILQQSGENGRRVENFAISSSNVINILSPMSYMMQQLMQLDLMNFLSKRRLIHEATKAQLCDKENGQTNSSYHRRP